ncbi:MDR family MFS transporter [Ramlibacter sp.]|uniref:MDR family MFS transporter n=1 Tax=Ramlibacter sp. TaxID=1917967 RepID=UPI001836BAE9|nr:MDR family MFS transporter [Ramlibacter sp.]MBA2676077.1 multidrug efflux MFS transporter [Ramlibacter sp.]
MAPADRSALRKWLGALAVFTGAVMGTLDTFVLYVATPHLRGVFSATASEISWISTSYAASALVCMLISGWAAERFGRRRVYQSAIGVFLAASVACGLTRSLELLVAVRVLQGGAAGVLLAVEMMILRQSFGPTELGKVIGVYGATTMVGPSLGPFLGGWIIDNLDWRAIFFINLPIGVLGFLLVQSFVAPDPPRAERAQAGVDWPGLVLLAVGMFSLIWLLERGDRLYWFETRSNVALLWLACASLALFVAHELMTPRPVVHLRVLRVPEFRRVVVFNFALYFLVTGTLFVLPIYMQELLRFSPTKAGTALAPRALVMMVVFPLVGMLFRRVPPKLLVCAGLAAGLASAVLMSGFTHETGLHDMMLPLILQGVAVALVLVPLTSVGLMSVDRADVPAASALDSTVRQLGASLGVAVFATLVTHFQLSNWGAVRHSVTVHNPLFYERFKRVNEFFMVRGTDDHTTLQSAYRLLSARVTQQVGVLTYHGIFELVAAAFAVLLAAVVVTRLQGREAA